MSDRCSRRHLWALMIPALLIMIAVSGCAGTTLNNTTGNASVNVNDNITGGPTTRSAIIGNVSDGGTAAGGVLVMAMPEDGNAPIMAVTDDQGHYSLGVSPGVRYRMAGRSYDPFGQSAGIDFRYPDGRLTDDITLASGQMVVLTSAVYRVHPPMYMFAWFNRETGNITPTSHSPVTVRGHVYLDDRPVGGAVVEAVPIPGADKVSAVTGDGGAYVLEIGMNTQYDLTATYQGLQHKVWPVYRESGETGIYDITLTRTPKAMLMGTAATENEPWLKRPGAVAIEAVPMYGDKPIAAAIGDDLSFSLEVEPYTYYNITGKFRSLNDSYYNVGIAYDNGIACSGFMLRPNETALVRYFTYEAVVEPEMNRTA